MPSQRTSTGSASSRDRARAQNDQSAPGRRAHRRRGRSGGRRHSLGCDPHALFAAISHSAGNSVMFENRVPHVLAGDNTSSYAVDVMVKDLGIVLDVARRADFPAPLTAAAHRQFVAASAAGYGAAEDIAVIKLFPS